MKSRTADCISQTKTQLYWNLHVLKLDMNVNVKLLRNRDKPKDRKLLCAGWTGLTFGCDRFISSPTGRWGMAMAHDAWPDVVKIL